MLNFGKKVTPQSAFGSGLTEKQKAERLAANAKRIAETKDAARKLCGTDEFKTFKDVYLRGREALIQVCKDADAKDHDTKTEAMAHLRVFDDLLSIEKKSE